MAAITIASDNVVLDLNGFVIDNRAAGLGTQAIGIAATDHSDLVIKNGKVEGFFYGIALSASGDTSQGNVVEDIRAYYNTYRGINLEFGVHRGAIVRNNLVLNTGGSTVSGRTTTNGILVAGGGAAVLNNKVTNTNDTTTSNTGIRVFGGENVIVNNRVAEVTGLGAVGINGGSPAVSKCSHNLTIGVTTGIINCTLVGSDNS